MKSRKRGPAPPAVRGPLATLRRLRLTFCSRRRSDLFTPPATQRTPRPSLPRPSPGAVRGIPRPRPPPRVHAPTCSPLHLVGFGSRPPRTPRARPSPGVSRDIPRHRPPPRAAVGIGSGRSYKKRRLLIRGQPPTYWNKSPNSPKSRSKCEIRIWSRRPLAAPVRNAEQPNSAYRDGNHIAFASNSIFSMSYISLCYCRN